MNKEEALIEVNDIFKEVLDNDDIKLDYETSADDVEDWDSLNHIQLVVAVEKHFKVRFTAHEIQTWQNIGEMLDNIIKKK
ncbi:acyl carrier protein [Mucilaginibacter sp. UYCu711]|uniref:acyl carrier protein n=1 Tax=Mucilaginibacter sp. UYCu711 TaxID=3156339 RepID=UPI003D245376